MPRSLHRENLVLIPTEFEAAQCPDLMQQLRERVGTIALCGFGPIVAAARTMQAINAFEPEAVILLGIAGSLQADFTVGKAYLFSEVVCHGVGVGSGKSHASALELGWKQWAGQDSEINQHLMLRDACDPPRQLVTCCAASSDESEADQKRALFPLAAAEDMEGFAVAVACRLAGVPLRIVRGISNRAGHRDFEKWQVEPAMAAALRLAISG